MDKEYLARQFKNYNDKAFHVDVTETHYVESESSAEGALEVVNTVTDSSTQVLLSVVITDIPTISVGDYVIKETTTTKKLKYPLAANTYTKSEVDDKLVGAGGVDLADYYNKNDVDTKVNAKVDKVTGKGLSTNDYTADDKTKVGKIGDFSTITITNVTDLVGALNKLDNQFMKSVSFKDKKVTLVYKNGATFDIDVSPIVTDTDIEELNNVLVSSLADGQILKYSLASGKWVNTTDTTLSDAKAYVDTQIANTHKETAKKVDTKPTADEASVNTWYYYADESGDYWMTMFIAPETEGDEKTEVTIHLGTVNLEDYINKEDVTSTFSENPSDLTKIPDLNWMSGMYTAVVTALSKKINTTDIVDNLASESTDKPLSANQGKALNVSIVGVSQILGSHTLNNDIHTTSTEKEANSNHIANTDIHTSVEEKTAITTHIDDTDIHVTTDDKTKWNDVENKVATDDFNTHTSNADIHVSSTEKTKWNTVEDKFDKANIVSLTLAEYNALETKDPDTYYNITDDAVKGDGSSINYSTDEVKTGNTWIDGRPIYRKTINFGALPNATSKEIAHGVSNVGVMYLVSPSFVYNAAGGMYPIQLLSTSSMSSQWSYSFSSTHISMSAGTNRSNMYAYITIEYTKTSD